MFATLGYVIFAWFLMTLMLSAVYILPVALCVLIGMAFDYVMKRLEKFNDK